jgi:hypothetical protein
MGFTYDIIQEQKTIAMYPFFQILGILRWKDNPLDLDPVINPRLMLLKCQSLVKKFRDEIDQIQIEQSKIFPSVKEELMKEIKSTSDLQSMYLVVEKFNDTKSKLYLVYQYDVILFFNENIEKLESFIKFLLNYQSEEYKAEFSC